MSILNVADSFSPPPLTSMRELRKKGSEFSDGSRTRKLLPSCQNDCLKRGRSYRSEIGRVQGSGAATIESHARFPEFRDSRFRIEDDLSPTKKKKNGHKMGVLSVWPKKNKKQNFFSLMICLESYFEKKKS